MKPEQIKNEKKHFFKSVLNHKYFYNVRHSLLSWGNRWNRVIISKYKKDLNCHRISEVCWIVFYTLKFTNIRKSAGLRPAFSSSCGGLQPSAATVGPFGPNSGALRAHTKILQVLKKSKNFPGVDLHGLLDTTHWVQDCSRGCNGSERGQRIRGMTSTSSCTVNPPTVLPC